MAPEQPKTQRKRRRPIRTFFGWFGIQRGSEKGKWVVLTRRFFLLLLLLIVVVVGGLYWFTFHYSNSPAFCGSCHYMEPYVESWKKTIHAQKGVECYDCHVEPGIQGTIDAKAGGLSQLANMITGRYRPMPQAEISDATCLKGGCHETRKLEGKVRFKDKYNFDHKTHLTGLRRGKKLRCTSCHSQIVQGQHLVVTEGVCFTCHFNGRPPADLGHDGEASGAGTEASRSSKQPHPSSRCTICHETPVEAIQTTAGATFSHKRFLDRKVACMNCHYDTIQGTGEVTDRACRSCHGNPDTLAKRSDSKLIHDWHVTKRKVECFQCHGDIRHGLRPAPAPERKTSCQTCHSGGHKVHADMYAGRGGVGVQGRPGPHAAANVDCVACHETFGRGHADVKSRTPTSQACVKCHGRGRKNTLGDWKSFLEEWTAGADEPIAAARKAYASLLESDPRRARAEKLLKAAEHNRNFVASASGAHNLDYAEAILKRAAEDAAKALKILQSPK